MSSAFVSLQHYNTQCSGILRQSFVELGMLAARTLKKELQPHTAPAYSRELYLTSCSNGAFSRSVCACLFFSKNFKVNRGKR